MRVILLALAAVLAVPIFYFPADWAGWLSLYAAFAAVPFLVSFKKRPRVVFAIWAAVLAHALIAAFNAYAGVIHGVEADAAKFHANAAAIAAVGGWDFGLGSRFYTTMLALAYTLGGP